MNDNPPRLKKSMLDDAAGNLVSTDVRRRFDRAAGAFDRADFVHRHAAREMLERMAPMQLEVARILDAGAAAGRASLALSKRFRGSHVIALDRSLPMLRQARRAHTRFRRMWQVQADAVLPPFADGSFDLVFANLLLPWISDLPAWLASTARILRKDGLFVFSSLGPDSLSELREAWAAIDDGEHVMRFADMHDVGDQLVRAGLREPVLDVDYLTLTYESLPSLFADLTAAGARNCLSGRRNTLTGRQRFARLRDDLERRFVAGRLALRLELVFGHAWGGGPPAPAGEFALNVDAIGRRRR